LDRWNDDGLDDLGILCIVFVVMCLAAVVGLWLILHD
jgi:hypothetical protein